jgi:2-methylcitrate dehydratase PrpD
MHESLTLAEYIAGLQYDSLPSSLIKATKYSILDTLGVIMAAGSLGEGCQQFVHLVETGKGQPKSSIIGFGFKAPSYMAAFTNGSMSHALDFEDTHDIAHVHPSAAVVPAALAIAESLGNINGKSFITAVALGIDMVSRLGLALKKDPIENGWYMPPILSAFGAAATAGKLLNLSPIKLLDAFSLTLCQATCSAEFTHTPRSIIRAIRDAFAAKAGVLSVLLAKEGIAGCDHPLEGKAGLFHLYVGEEHDLSKLVYQLGTVFEGINVSFKPWPSCRGTHYFIEATLKLVNDNDLKADEIEGITVVINPTPINMTLCEPFQTKQRPLTVIDAKFSIPFTAAIAAVKRSVTLDDFTPESLKSDRILKVAGSTLYQVDKNIQNSQGYIEIKGRKESFRSEAPQQAFGHPQNAMDED